MRWIVKSLLVAAACVAATAPLLLAQELKSLRSAIVGEAEQSYPKIRCSGLNLAVIGWGGEEKFGKDFHDTVLQTTAAIMAMAVEMRQPTLGEDSLASVIRDTENVRDLYLDRFASNYAKFGEIFGQDAMILDDLAVCNTLFGVDQ